MRSLFWTLIFISGISHAESTRTNPDISLNALIIDRFGNKGNDSLEAPNGLDLQEAELRLTTNVDAYFRGDVVLAVEREEATLANPNPEFKLEPEEAFVETISLPYLTLRAGKFYAFLDRHNQLHTHSFPFIDSPISSRTILGDEGLNETGLAASFTLPMPWFSEVTVQALSARNEILFGSTGHDDVAGLGLVRNLWDLSDASTLELDLAYGNGKTVADELNQIFSGSVTVKWRPVENTKYTSFSWTTQYLTADKVNDAAGAPLGRRDGLSSWIQYQIAQRWWIQGREEYVGDPGDMSTRTKKHSFLVGFIPTEYSALRVQYDLIEEPSVDPKEQRITLQLNTSMGTHPAHTY